jgi:glutamate racemase
LGSNEREKAIGLIDSGVGGRALRQETGESA